MAEKGPSQSYGRFWGNVVLIALAHVAPVAGLIRWSVAAKASSNSESIVWLGGAGDFPTGELKKQESPSLKQPTTATESRELEQDETAEEKRTISTAKSEIELPSATSRPTATSTPLPKSSATPAPRPKVTPQPSAKPTPRKTVVVKTSPKPTAKAEPSPWKPTEKPEKKIALAKKDSASQNRSAQSRSIGKAGPAGDAGSASEFGWYGNMLHDRFYSAWIQPSANVTVNESVAAVAKQVSQVDPPPTALIKGDHYDVKINFELNTEEKPEN